MNPDSIYEIWLSRCLGDGTDYSGVVSEFGSARAAFEASEVEWRLLGFLSAAKIAEMSKRDLSQARLFFEQCSKNGWSVVSQNSSEFPQLLLSISHAPSLLYVWGDLGYVNNKMTVSLVGARDASNYGREITRRLSASLVRAGAVVVSGGAVGIDCAAHEAAIAAGGKTVLVLGCGLGAKYLPENEALRLSASKNGAVISEYPPFSMPSRSSFPKRNRIISGLSLATVIIEAGAKSGSLGTAKWALEQGRDVCAVPGDLISSAYIGSNILIANGAKPVFSAADILSDYVYSHPELVNLETVERALDEAKNPEKPFLKPAVPKNISADAVAVFAVLGSGPMHFDEIVSAAGLDVVRTASALTELEIEGVATLESGKRYSAVSDR